MIGADSAASFWARALSDAHPPTYYVLAYGWSFLAGPSDAATRLLSAICAVGAIAVFVWRMPGELGARLFAGALASSSIFWVYQSQNARSYSLGLLMMSLVLSRCMTDLKDQRRAGPGRFVVTAALFGAAAMVHPYMLLVCIASLAMLFVLNPRLRLQSCLLGALLFSTAGAYYLLVVPRHSMFSTGESWISGGAGWFLFHAIDAIKQSYGVFGALALALCGIAFIASIIRRGSSARERLAVLFDLVRHDRMAIFCIGVALLTLVGGYLTSLLTPTFTTRNFLLVSPFLWGLTARIYELGLSETGLRWRPALNGVIAILTILSGTIVLARTAPHNEPFRETASWIRQHPECKGAMVPVISAADPAWSEPGFRRQVEESQYDHYLGAFAKPAAIFSAELDAGTVPPPIRAELARRAHGQGCPVLAWVSHRASDAAVPSLGASISRNAGARAGLLRVHSDRAVTLGLHSFALLDKLFPANSRDTVSSFVFYSSGEPARRIMAPPVRRSGPAGSDWSTRTSAARRP